MLSLNFATGRRGCCRLAATGLILLIMLIMAEGCGGPTASTDEAGVAPRAFAPVQGPWAATGGPSGPVTAIAVDPGSASTLYARSGDRVFKTVDGGATWSALSQTFQIKATTPPLPASAMLLTSSTLYVGGFSRVFQSTDGGQTWTTSAELSGTVLCSVTNGINPLAGVGPRPVVARQVLSLAQDASGTLYAGTMSGIFKSTDGGQTWQAVGVGGGLIDPCHQASQQFILKIVVDPATPTTLYAGGLDGAYKSTDSGATWTTMNGQGLTSASQGLRNVTVTALALHPADPATVYLATDGGTATVATPASLRVDPSLVSMMVGQIQQLAPVLMDAAGNQVGLGGLTWSSTDTSVAAVSATGLVSAVAAGTASILASTIVAPVTSAVVSVTVTAPVATGPPVTLGVATFAIFPEIASIQVGATQQFAVTIKDIAGQTLNNLFLQSLSWTTNNTAVISLSSTGLATGLSGGFATVMALVSASPGPGATPTSPGIGGVFSRSAAVVVSHGLVFRSPDRGFTWSRRSTGLPLGVSISAVAIHPQTPTTLYAGTSAGVYRSTDAGLTWAATRLQVPVTVLAMDPQGIVYAGAVNGLFKSADNGTTWTTGQGLTKASITALTADPAAPTTLYAGADGGGVFVSANGGLWSAMSTGLSQFSVSALARDALAGLLYAGTWGGGAFKSADGGATWTTTGTLHPFIAALLADPLVASTAYAATNGGGVYKTTDGGATWILTGLVSVNALSLAFDPAGATTLYAGTTNGVFKSQDRGLSWTSAGLDQPAPARGLGPGAGQVVLALARGAATLYAGTDGGGVFKSTDAGATWTAMNTGLTRLTVFALAVDPASSATVYAGTPAGVFRSLDGGLTWSAFSDGLTDLSAQALAFGGSALYAGTRAGVFTAQ